jgi:septation ring formation regulator EzrA
MDNREKLDKMDRALRLLEDLKNSQAALIEKSSQLQMDAMSFNFPEMEKNMGELSSRYNESLDLLNEELERFETKRDKFEKDNGLATPEL